MDKYLLRIKTIRDQLMVAGEYVSDNDVMIAALAGLPREFATIRSIILARDSNVTMKEFRALLIGAERENDVVLNSLTHNMTGFTGGVLSAAPLPQQMSFFPQSQMMQPAFGSHQSSYVSGGGCVGSMEHHPQDHSRQHQTSVQFPGSQQRFSNGGQSRGNNTYRSGFKVLHHISILNVRFVENGDIVFWNVITGEIIPINLLALLLLLDLHFLGHAPSVQGMNGSQTIHTSDFSYSIPPAVQAMNVQSSPSYSNAANWIVDTGASHHMTSDLASLHQVSSFEGAICYNLQTQKLVLSRHVIHDESVFPAKCQPSEMLSSHSVPSLVTSTPFPVPFRASSVHDSVSPEPVQLQRQGSGTQESGQGSGTQESGSLSSSSVQDLQQPLSPVLSPANPQVSPPISVSDWNQSSASIPPNITNTRSMTTRLQTGAIQRRDYTVFCASFPELQSLGVGHGSLCSDGFSFLAESVECEEPKSFKIAATNSNWQHAMQDEFDALKGLREPGMLSSQDEIFDLKDMGRLTYFLGLHIQYKSNGDMFLSQTKYAQDLIKQAGMENCRPAPTPSKPHTQLLLSAGQPLSDPTPDIHISAYSDTDWGSDINTRRSVTGYVVFLGSNPVSWQSKKQSSVSRSSTEAEYKALANCAADVAHADLGSRWRVCSCGSK
ncbi:hypothetical protein D8674_005155 [Pyrus ussuriensis x Pyrus communis]|uniref:Reverse transcriptase Ty1/copia-type domain-containing protein n=1 Tax=Pyrus ussuriensis x Pyrus communis TaxID=2448454 RepID=A0A5N5FQM9_9ROSA|nr:hypothetical protein D8674_005155 [Pyrus ussuriensis x Pyrus communis]